MYFFFAILCRKVLQNTVKGSRIGSNCVVGANSLVNGKLDNNYLYVGNPVKALKKINDGSERV